MQRNGRDLRLAETDALLLPTTGADDAEMIPRQRPPLVRTYSKAETTKAERFRNR